jgi:hypothetical protein
MLHGACVGVEAGAQNLVFFPCKVAAGGDEGQLVCEAVAGTLVLMFFDSPLVFCDEWLLCVPSSIRLFSFWPQIALQ